MTFELSASASSILFSSLKNLEQNPPISIFTISEMEADALSFSDCLRKKERQSSEGGKSSDYSKKERERDKDDSDRLPSSTTIDIPPRGLFLFFNDLVTLRCA